METNQREKALTIGYLSYHDIGKEFLINMSKEFQKMKYNVRLISFYCCLSDSLERLEKFPAPDILFVDLKYSDYGSFRYRVRHLLKNGLFKKSKIVWLFEMNGGVANIQRFYSEIDHHRLADHCDIKEKFGTRDLLGLLESFDLPKDVQTTLLRQPLNKKEFYAGTICDVVMYSPNFIYIESDILLKKGDQIGLQLTISPYDDHPVNVTVISKFSYSRGRFSNTYIMKIEHPNKDLMEDYIENVDNEMSNIPLRTVRILGLNTNHPFVLSEHPNTYFFHNNDPKTYLKSVIKRAPNVIGYQLDSVVGEEWNTLLGVIYSCKSLPKRPRIVIFSEMSINVKSLQEDYPELELVKGHFNLTYLNQIALSIHEKIDFIKTQAHQNTTQRLYQTNDDMISAQATLISPVVISSVTSSGIDMESSIAFNRPVSAQILGSEGVLPPMKFVSGRNISDRKREIRGYWQMVNDRSSVDPNYIKLILSGLR